MKIVGSLVKSAISWIYLILRYSIARFVASVVSLIALLALTCVWVAHNSFYLRYGKGVMSLLCITVVSSPGVHWTVCVITLFFLFFVTEREPLRASWSNEKMRGTFLGIVAAAGADLNAWDALLNAGLAGRIPQYFSSPSAAEAVLRDWLAASPLRHMGCDPLFAFVSDYARFFTVLWGGRAYSDLLARIVARDCLKLQTAVSGSPYGEEFWSSLIFAVELNIHCLTSLWRRLDRTLTETEAALFARQLVCTLSQTIRQWGVDPDVFSVDFKTRGRVARFIVYERVEEQAKLGDLLPLIDAMLQLDSQVLTRLLRNYRVCFDDFGAPDLGLLRGCLESLEKLRSLNLVSQGSIRGVLQISHYFPPGFAYGEQATGNAHAFDRVLLRNPIWFNYSIGGYVACVALFHGSVNSLSRTALSCLCVFIEKHVVNWRLLLQSNCFQSGCLPLSVFEAFTVELEIFICSDLWHSFLEALDELCDMLKAATEIEAAIVGFTTPLFTCKTAKFLAKTISTLVVGLSGNVHYGRCDRSPVHWQTLEDLLVNSASPFCQWTRVKPEGNASVRERVMRDIRTRLLMIGARMQAGDRALLETKDLILISQQVAFLFSRYMHDFKCAKELKKWHHDLLTSMATSCSLAFGSHPQTFQVAHHIGTAACILFHTRASVASLDKSLGQLRIHCDSRKFWMNCLDHAVPRCNLGSAIIDALGPSSIIYGLLNARDDSCEPFDVVELKFTTISGQLGVAWLARLRGIFETREWPQDPLETISLFDTSDDEGSASADADVTLEDELSELLSATIGEWSSDQIPMDLHVVLDIIPMVAGVLIERGDHAPDHSRLVAVLQDVLGPLCSPVFGQDAGWVSAEIAVLLGLAVVIKEKTRKKALVVASDRLKGFFRVEEAGGPPPALETETSVPILSLSAELPLSLAQSAVVKSDSSLAQPPLVDLEAINAVFKPMVLEFFASAAAKAREVSVAVSKLDDLRNSVTVELLDRQLSLEDKRNVECLRSTVNAAVVKSFGDGLAFVAPLAAAILLSKTGKDAVANQARRALTEDSRSPFFRPTKKLRVDAVVTVTEDSRAVNGECGSQVWDDEPQMSLGEEQEGSVAEAADEVTVRSPVIPKVVSRPARTNCETLGFSVRAAVEGEEALSAVQQVILRQFVKWEKFEMPYPLSLVDDLIREIRVESFKRVIRVEQAALFAIVLEERFAPDSPWAGKQDSAKVDASLAQLLAEAIDSRSAKTLKHLKSSLCCHASVFIDGELPALRAAGHGLDSSCGSLVDKLIDEHLSRALDHMHGTVTVSASTVVNSSTVHDCARALAVDLIEHDVTINNSDEFRVFLEPHVARFAKSKLHDLNPADFAVAVVREYGEAMAEEEAQISAFIAGLMDLRDAALAREAQSGGRKSFTTFTRSFTLALTNYM